MIRRYLALPLLALLLIMGSGPVAPLATATAVTPWHDDSLRAREYAAAEQVWHANLARNEAVVHPSRAYAGVWLRDSFWTFLGLGNGPLAQRALGHFAGRQLPDGQVPTQFTTFLRGPLYRADESTLLFLIWANWQADQGYPLRDGHRLKLALSYVRSQARAGYYISRPGSYASWFDGFRVPRADTLSYNQGLYAVALMAARHLRLGVGSQEIAAARGAYRSLAAGPDGYLRFSRQLGYHDISGLVGDFLAYWFFRQPILSDSVVASTLNSQPAFQSGFKVVTDAQGHALPSRSFVSHFFAGDYQNGGSWLLFDYVGLADGCLHGTPQMCARMAERLRLEFRHGAVFHEYLNTDPNSPLFQGEAAYRDTFSWDTFVLRVDAVLTARAGAAPGRVSG
ncbi:MAG TPA: hypothetical protein VIJ28_12450 [Chloroflexota bacterium]